MNSAVVTSAPVVMTTYPPDHPVVAHKGAMREIGITGILIGVYAIGLGIYYLAAAGDINGYSQVTIQVYALVIYVAAGIWFIICGSLAVAVANNPNRCLIIGGIIVAILASLAAFGLMIMEGRFTFTAMSLCQDLDCGAIVGQLLAHAIMGILSLIEFILVIVHASYNCACCGRSYGQPVTSTMTVTTTSARMMQPVQYPVPSTQYSTVPGAPVW